jgi:hypothetical protein
MTKINPEIQLGCASMMNRKQSTKSNRPVVTDFVRTTSGKFLMGTITNILNSMALIHTCEVNLLNGTIQDGDWEVVHLDMIETTDKPKTKEELFTASSMCFYKGK